MGSKYDIYQVFKGYVGKKVGIIGNGVTTIGPNGAYFDYSKAYEKIWVVNGGHVNHEYADVEFMMDDWASPAHDTDYVTRNIKAERMAKCPIPIVTTTAYDDFPCLVEYPLKDVVRRLKCAYFGETVSYMVALAIFLEVDEINMLGTDYIGCKPDERACTEHWCGYARGKGINVFTNSNSHFLKTQLDARNNFINSFYGYLPGTFPFKTRLLDNGLMEVSFNSDRTGEINEFKKEYKSIIEERNGTNKNT